jgi:putative tricarboxylic transport membrane protein
LVAAESANNGSTGGAMIHLLTLGIPGSAATAVMMGVFLIHGIQPGPLLFTRQPEQVYTLFAGMILANVLMIGLGFLAAMGFAALMRVPAPLLTTFIVIFCFIGAFALRNDMADVWLTMLFGVLGFVMRRWDLPVPPMVMGIILGPMAEQYFLTSMVSHGNDLSVFVTRPVSAVALGLAAAAVAWAVWRNLTARRRLAELT